MDTSKWIISAESPESVITPTFAARSNPELLMVGVMTTAKFLSTRACAVYQTWAQHIQGKALYVHRRQAILATKGIKVGHLLLFLPIC